MEAKSASQVYWFSRRDSVERGAYLADGEVVFKAEMGAEAEGIVPVAKIGLKGAHNVENVLAAVCAARLAGVSAEAIRSAVEGFRAVEHRLEFVATLNGVDYYNDSKATNVDAAAKAICSFAGGIHLILGGKDKNSDYTQLSALLRERVKTVYTIGSAAEKIEGQIRGDALIIRAGTLAVAVERAGDSAMPGEVVLLAPACSSFDQFANYEERGRVFKSLVMARRGASAGVPAWQSA
jgi:UDP-N-acetylmuramoylalanine--D-glutamate ligase